MEKPLTKEQIEAMQQMKRGDAFITASWIAMDDLKKREFVRTRPQRFGHWMLTEAGERALATALAPAPTPTVPTLTRTTVPNAPGRDAPRRVYVDLQTPAEKAIQAAIHAVEDAGADVRLTKAVILLGEAKDTVADWVDGVPPPPEPTVRVRIEENRVIAYNDKGILAVMHLPEHAFTTPAPKLGKRTCNRHDDCDAADARAKVAFEENKKKPFREQREYMQPYAEHCHDEDCEDCFGK